MTDPQYRVFSGERLRRARESAGLRREDLASWGGICYSSIVGYELHGKAPNANTLARFADTLKVPIDQLFV